MESARLMMIDPMIMMNHAQRANSSSSRISARAVDDPCWHVAQLKIWFDPDVRQGISLYGKRLRSGGVWEESVTKLQWLLYWKYCCSRIAAERRHWCDCFHDDLAAFVWHWWFGKYDRNADVVAWWTTTHNVVGQTEESWC